jgi:poly-gamma-glutamate synthesis protein (capsule biosynthesis protein)
VRGIEVYQGRPIFYSLGSFFYETEYIDPLPAEHYQSLGLSPDASREAFLESRSWLSRQQATWEGVLALMEVEDASVKRINLIPLNMGWRRQPPARGRPHLAEPDLAEAIIGKIRKRSQRYGTRIEYSTSEKVGMVRI